MGWCCHRRVLAQSYWPLDIPTGGYPDPRLSETTTQVVGCLVTTYGRRIRRPVSTGQAAARAWSHAGSFSLTCPEPAYARPLQESYEKVRHLTTTTIPRAGSKKQG